MSILLDGKKLSDLMTQDLIKEFKNFQNSRLIVFTSDDEASKVYVKNKIKKGKEIGIDVVTIPVIYKEQIEETLNDNNFPFIIQKPSNLTDKEIDELLDKYYNRDMDGFSNINLGKIAKDKINYIPTCTPKGILTLLDYYNIPIKHKKIVIIGRSNIVGKPLSYMLTNKDATVTLCHSKTDYKDLINYCEQADIIVSAVGYINILKDWIAKDHQVLIDVGINRDENGKLCGDFSFNTVQNCYAYTPVPGGIGPMTVITLMKNTVDYYKTLKNM